MKKLMFACAAIVAASGFCLDADSIAASDNGEVNVQCKSGGCEIVGGGETNGVKDVTIFRMEAERGNANAQYKMGLCYAIGHGVETNVTEAVKWYHKAAEQENADAQYMLGLCYSIGDGVDKNAVEAVKWYRKAAEQGHAEAQSKMAFRCWTGDGVEKSAAEAVKWMRKAADQGREEEMLSLGEAYLIPDLVQVMKSDAEIAKAYPDLGLANIYGIAKGLGLIPPGYVIDAEKDASFFELFMELVEECAKHDADERADAMRWLANVAKNGKDNTRTSCACYELSVAYLYGIGVDKDEATAMGWLRKSAELGLATAQAILGAAYSGDAELFVMPETNMVEAAKWYRKAAEQGLPVAQFALGCCYDDGDGVETNATEAAKWYRKAAEQENVDAQYMLGVCYAIGDGVDKNAAEAVKWYSKAAEQGLPAAQFSLGCCYEDGDGVETNDTEAVKWYGNAAEQGQVYAQFRLGVAYALGKGVETNAVEAAKWCRNAAEQENVDAQYMLGVCYAIGDGVETNAAEAVKWYRKAAEQGHAKAQSEMAFHCLTGDGVEKSAAEAVKWMRKAAAQGREEEMFSLGIAYLIPDLVQVMKSDAEMAKAYPNLGLANIYEIAKGLGLIPPEYVIDAEKDASFVELVMELVEECAKHDADERADAMRWLENFAKNGKDNTRTSCACYELSLAYLHGIGVDKDEATAMGWLRKSAELGLATAQAIFGAVYSGDAKLFVMPETNMVEAVKWYRKAAEQGLPAAQFALGGCYAIGHGVETNVTEAVKWYRKAAEQGQVDAQYQLGVCYAFGKGVETNATEAAKWYRKAAEQGHAEAQYALGWCHYYGKGVEEDETEAMKWFHDAAAQGNSHAESAIRAIEKENRSTAYGDSNEIESWWKQLEYTERRSKRYEYGDDGQRELDELLDRLRKTRELDELLDRLRKTRVRDELLHRLPKIDARNENRKKEGRWYFLKQFIDGLPGPKWIWVIIVVFCLIGNCLCKKDEQAGKDKDTRSPREGE